MSFQITNTTKEKLPNQPFKKMAERVLGKKYDLSLTIVDAAEIKQLNLQISNKNTVN